MDKKVVDADNDGSKRPSRILEPSTWFRNPLEVAEEIWDFFQRASDSGALIAKILEVSKLPHNRKHATCQAKFG